MGAKTSASAMSVKEQLATAIRIRMLHDDLNVSGVAKKLRTSRNSVMRILDKRNTSITLNTIARTAKALGFEIQFAVKPASPFELDRIAKRISAAKSKSEAQKLKALYLAAFYGTSNNAQNPAV